MGSKQPVQTPMMLLLGGGDNARFLECKKALANCGFPEIAFGSYSQVLKAQAAARKITSGGTPPTSGVGKTVAGLPGPQQQFLAQGQSGHMATNSLFKQPGGRGDPCANLPGCAGYDDNAAAATVHQGMSTDPGTPHYEITQAEGPFAQTQAGPNGTLDMNGVGNCVDNTSNIAVGGQDPSDTANPQRAQEMAQVQQASADSLNKQDQGAGVSTGGGTAAPGANASGSSDNPTQPKGGGDGLTADQQTAKECMKELWKKQSDKARKDFCDRNRTPGAGNTTTTPPDGSAAAQQNKDLAAANNDLKKQIKAAQNADPPDAAAIAALQAQQDANSATIAQNKADCKEAQANYLASFYDQPPPNNQPPPYNGMRPPPEGGGDGEDEEEG
jgi:hypothetical protein